MRIEAEEGQAARKALVSAAKSGDVEALARALAQGCSLDDQDEMGNSALMWAAGYGRKEAVAWLLARGARHDLTESGGGQALDWCACAVDPLEAGECVRMLLAAGSDVMSLDHSGWCALMHASHLCNEAVCKALVESMPDSELLKWLPRCEERAKMRGGLELAGWLGAVQRALMEKQALSCDQKASKFGAADAAMKSKSL